LRGGREHADMGGAVCSAAAGHGRNWGIGAVTGCYGPLLLGTREVKSKVTGAVEVKQANGQPGLPGQVMSLVRHTGTAIDGIKFYNGGDSKAMFSWRFKGDEWQEEIIGAGECVERQAVIA